jgi:mannose-6-phosphate isomerase-like protein (cupin superfamily)
VGPAALARFRRRALGRSPVVLSPRDSGWRAIAPGFDAIFALARAGVPFQTAVDRRYDRSGDPRILRRALREGRTVFFPQIHQVLPRLARLMVALRVALAGPAGEECSFLFAVEGRGREGMGLHHDGNVDAFWLQLEGRRTVTIGPPVRPRTPLDLPDSRATTRGRGWRTFELPPGSLFHLPPRTPHRVVCHGRSLAISLTWARARRRRRAATSGRRARALGAWDVVGGRAILIPQPARDRLWVQLPVVVERVDRRRREFVLRSADGTVVSLRAGLRGWATGLALMPCLPRADVPPDARDRLLRTGILAPVDLPLAVRPERPRALDGWRFA